MKPKQLRIVPAKEGEIGLPEDIIEALDWKTGQRPYIEVDKQFQEVYLWRESPSD